MIWTGWIEVRSRERKIVKHAQNMITPRDGGEKKGR